uniref:Sodium/hydrogen exchanger n=1 Tax=Dermatophagoides pteronyssinus TaxID=6956 RepID=A0A6P6Y6Q4_DERPT|nr:sodium/hydrogen exchanger 9-like isoform X3 [Dermatophagoides pteronyssinus]
MIRLLRFKTSTTKWILRSIHRFSMLIVGLIFGVQASEFLVIRQDQKARDLHRLDSLNLLSYVTIMIIIVCTIWLFKHRRVRFLHDFFHETGLAISYGLIVGALIRYSGSDTKVSQLRVSPKDEDDSSMNITSDVPPDMLWITFDVPRVVWSLPNNYKITFANETSLTEQKSYAYIFKGELFNPKTDSTIPQNQHFSEKATFDPEIFFNLILPVIVFNAGYSLKKKSFFRNLGPIIVYAFIGTTISCFVVGIVLYLVKYLMPITMREFTFSDCLYFGAIISATDPVTVLAIFTDLHVDVKLNALVFGEAIFNDVVSIVLASLIEKFKEHISSGFIYAISNAATYFLNIFLFSLLEGAFFGCITALVTKHTRLFDHPLLESTLFFLMSYASFLLAEVLELSGIISVLFCGICQAHYTYNNLSPESRTRTKQLFAMANFIAENFIFAYIGVSMFTFPQHLWNTGFILTTFVAIIIGRALNVYPLSYLMNFGGRNKIPTEFQHILFFSGLRGAMAFALAIRNTLTAPRRLMLTATSIISIVSVIFCGCTIQPLLHYFQIATNVDESHSLDDVLDQQQQQQPGTSNDQQPKGGFDGFRRRTDSISSDLITPTDDITITNHNQISIQNPNHHQNEYEKAWLVRKWYNFDVNFMKPLLTHSRPTLLETMPKFCEPLSRILTSTQQLEIKDDFTGSETGIEHQKMNIMSLNNELHTDNNYYRHPHHQQQQQQQNQEDTKLNPFTNRKNYFDYNNLQNNNRTNYFPAPSPSSSTTTTTMMNDANITGSGSSTVAEIIPKSLNVRKKHSPSPSSQSSSSTSKLSPKNGKSGQLNKSQLPSQKTNNRPISSTDSTSQIFLLDDQK